MAQQQDGNTFEFGGKRWTKLDFVTQQSQKPEIEFLPPEVPFESVALYSFMRCGNIMLRNYIEKISGFYTGYDLADHPEFDVKGTKKTTTQAEQPTTTPKESTPEEMGAELMAQIDKQLTLPLFSAGLRGEGLRGKDVWVTQTYFPGLPNCAQYRVQKTVLLARNPFDAYYSMFTMLATVTHTETLPDEVFRQKIDLFNMFVKQNLDIFVAPYKYWLEQAIPTHLIRFEDLLQRPVETLRSLFEFLLDEPSLVGTALEARIKQVVETSAKALREGVEAAGGGKDARVIYKPRSGKVNAALQYYSAEMQQAILEKLGDYMRDFSYIGKSTTARRSLYKMEGGVLTALKPGDEEEDAEGNDFISTWNRKSLARLVERRKKFSDMRALVDGVESAELGNMELVIGGGDFAGGIVQLCALVNAQESESKSAPTA